MSGSSESPADWLVAECVRSLRAAAGDDPIGLARALGAQAADASCDVRELVVAFLHAGSIDWATTAVAGPAADRAAHARAARLFDVLRDLVGAALDGYQDRARTEIAHHDSQRSEFVNDLLTGRADPGHLAERAHRYGIRLSAHHVVIVAAGRGLTDVVAQQVDAALATRYGAGNTLTTLRERQLVCISAGGLRGLPAELAHHLLTRLGTGRWQIGVGRAHPGLAGVATSLEEARNTLDLAARLGFTTAVLHASDLLVFPVLLRDRAAITDLVSTVLGPLTGARGGAQPYLDTLTALFDNEGNHAAAARQLHLSVRALSYRLDRIRSLTGYHPGEPTQRFTLHTAVLGARLLGWPTNVD
jgi:sugar diacid utilization regulator